MSPTSDRQPIIPAAATVREQLAYHSEQVVLLRRLLRLALAAERSSHAMEARHAR